MQLTESDSGTASRSGWRLPIPRVVRSLSTTALVVAAVAAVSGGVGIASAATGRAFILGRSNSETSTARLSDSRGTPLSLSAPKNTPPLAVNRTAMVRNLNVQYVSGKSADYLEPAGGASFGAGQSTSIATTGWTEVATTVLLAGGTYYVTATASIGFSTGATTALCMIAADDNPADPLQEGGGDGTVSVSAAETVAVQVSTGGALQEYCSTNGSSPSTAQDAGILAVRMLSSSGTPAAAPASVPRASPQRS